VKYWLQQGVGPNMVALLRQEHWPETGLEFLLLTRQTLRGMVIDPQQATEVTARLLEFIGQAIAST
jgi:hypothetical protein